jgi:hypothetical protein
MKIEAFRPERWRYLRLLDIFEQVQEAADRAFELDDPLEELSDRKGDFTVTWSDEAAARKYHALVDEAWARIEPKFESILHRWQDDADVWQSFEIEGPGWRT